MLNELGMAFRLMIRPNQTFAALRDDDRRYFTPSVVLMLLVGAYFSLVSAIMPPVDAWSIASGTADFGVGVLATVAGAGITYYICRSLGGNKNWRKVFTVIFYLEATQIPLAVILPMFLVPLWDEFYYVPAYIAVLVWYSIFFIKAVKVLNDFSTIKAVCVWLLIGVIFLLLAIPFIILGIWWAVAPLELPGLQIPGQ